MVSKDGDGRTTGEMALKDGRVSVRAALFKIEVGLDAGRQNKGEAVRFEIKRSV
jgi:hypothetical protein